MHLQLSMGRGRLDILAYYGGRFFLTLSIFLFAHFKNIYLLVLINTQLHEVKSQIHLRHSCSSKTKL